MVRLTHAPPAFLRSMQMSRSSVFFFVEGWSDRYFYNQLVEPVCNEAAVGFEMYTAYELGGVGGKAALLGFFEYLRRRRQLTSDLGGKRTAALFFLDKDVDDFMRTMKRSPHVLYTEYYDAENYLFVHGNLAQAAAAAAALEPTLLRQGLGNYNDWRRAAAAKWRPWVSLCLFTRLRNLNSAYAYGRKSTINRGPAGQTDAAALQQALAEIAASTRQNVDAFRRAMKRLERRVAALYNAGDHDRIFKGKWYASLTH